MMRVQVLLLLLVLGGLLASCGSAANDRFAAYLRAAAGGEADRGWSYLDEVTRKRGYANDLDAYLRDAAAVDWSALNWADAAVGLADDGFVHVTAELRSPPASVPAFLVERGLVHGVCRDGVPVGIGAFVEAGPYGTVLGAGGETGGQRICNNLFLEASTGG